MAKIKGFIDYFINEISFIQFEQPRNSAIGSTSSVESPIEYTDPISQDDKGVDNEYDEHYDIIKKFLKKERENNE